MQAKGERLKVKGFCHKRFSPFIYGLFGKGLNDHFLLPGSRFQRDRPQPGNKDYSSKTFHPLFCGPSASPSTELRSRSGNTQGPPFGKL